MPRMLAKPRPAGPAQLHRVEPEADARIRDVLAEVLLVRRHQHRPHLAVVERRQELERLGIDAGLGLVGAEHADAIGLQRGGQRRGGGVQLQRFAAGRASTCGLAPSLLRRSGRPALPRGGRMTIVRNCSLRNRRPSVELRASSGGRSRPRTDRRTARAEVDLDAAADQVMIEDEPSN